MRVTRDDDGMSPGELVQWIQLEAIPAAAAEVRRTYQAWVDAKAFKEGLCGELRELAQQLEDDAIGLNREAGNHAA